MPNKSQQLKDGFAVLPDSITELLDKTLPEPPTISIPTTVDDAIIAQGVLSKYLLDVFKELTGFSIAAAMMHIGQLNTVNQVVALASLQVQPNWVEIEVILPSDAVFYSTESSFLCEIAIDGNAESIDAVTLHRIDPDSSTLESAMLTGQEAVDLELLTEEDIQENHFYAEQIISTAGDYEYSFSAFVNDSEVNSDSITISIV